MVKRAHGPQQNTRKILKKKARDRGKLSVVKFFQEFKEGERVMIKAEPSVKKNIPHRRFLNKPGIIIGKRGHAYRVRVNDLNKEKDIFVLPIHLRRLK